MQKPKVMILTTCPDGHQVEMFPNKVIRIYDSQDESVQVYAAWECPRCENGGRFEVELA